MMMHETSLDDLWLQKQLLGESEHQHASSQCIFGVFGDDPASDGPKAEEVTKLKALRLLPWKRLKKYSN